MRSTKTFFTLLFAAALGVAASACAPNLCQRKNNWFASHCSGGDVTTSPDNTCEAMIDRCDQAHVQALNAYVSCLESQNVCSLDTIAQCGQANPGGVNLMCTGG